MDIRKFAVEETFLVVLYGVDDEPLVGDDGQPMTVTVYGPGSKPFARAYAAQQNRLVRQYQRKGKADQSAEEKAREQTEFLVACTKEFSANIEYEGLAGEALFKAVYSDIKLGFITEKVSKEVVNWANFTKGSTKS